MDLARQFVIRESTHRIHNALTPEKLARLGQVLRLDPGARVLDLASGSGEMLCTWARDHEIGGVGVDISTAFTDSAMTRSIELGVSDRVTFVHDDASSYVAEHPVDVAACLGATWIGEGPLGTIDLLERSLLPGGMVLIGEPFWIKEPETEDEVRGSGATERDTFTSMPELVASFRDHGWDLVQMVLADQDDWDHYAGAQWLNLRRWLDANPGDELWDEMRAELDTRPLEHVTYRRNYLGWGVFALMKR